jgi:large subunit ribosomal protein L25
MPGNIPVAIEYDVSGLEIGDQLHVRDLVLGSGVDTQVDRDAVVAQVAAPRVVSEEVEGEEGEEGAEGGEAPGAGGADSESSDEGDGE